MLAAQRVAWAQERSDQELIDFIRLGSSIILPGHECFALALVLADRLEIARDRSDFEASALDFDPDERPVVAEAATDAPADASFGITGVQETDCTDLKPDWHAHYETAREHIKELTRARRLHKPVTAEDFGKEFIVP